MRVSRRKLALALSLLLVLFLPSASFAANFGDFSVSLPAGSAVTMGDPTGTLSFTVTNDPGSSKNIKTVFFNIDDSLYEFDASTVAPTSCAGTWSVQGDKAACSLPGCISFTSGGGISPGGSCTFDIVVTGAGDTAIHNDTEDQADSLVSVVASSNAGASQQTGEFSLAGGLPTWQRKSLAIVMAASPSSTGVGGQIVVTMAVTNRSSAIQSGLVGCDLAPAACPGFPEPAGTGGVTAIGSPIYGSTAFTANPPSTSVNKDMDAAQTTVPASDTTGYPGTGRLLVGTELIDYSGISGNDFAGASRGMGGTSAAPHAKWDLIYSQDTGAFTLGVGETANIKWIYEAASSGFVYFSSYASNSSGTATSKQASTGTVVIGDFTAVTEVTPLSVISGQKVFVTVTASNNSGTTLTDIIPSLAAGASASATLVAGPEPASLNTLAPGESAEFKWEYTITGTLGQTYNFTGSASSDTINTNSATSETGSVATYTVTVSPGTVSTGTTSFSPTWTVYNNGSVEVKEVRIDISPPLSTSCAPGSEGWSYQSDAPPANWSSATAGAPVSSVTFTANNPVGTNGIQVGQSKDFTITFNCVPLVTSDTTYNFPVVITDKNNNVATVNSEIVVTAYELVLAAYDEDCSSPSPPSKPADGISRYCFVATLTLAGSPVSGETISFSATAGTPSAPSGVTDANGQAAAYLRAPCSDADVSAMATAEYNSFTSDSRTVDFAGVATGTLSYVPGSLTFNRTDPPPTGDINPVSIDTGDTGTFRLDVLNCGPDDVIIHPDDTSLAITSGSPDTFAIDSAVDVTVFSLGSATLTFVSGTIQSGPLQCYPVLTVDADSPSGTEYAGPYAFDKASPGDEISNTVTLSGGVDCTAGINIRILDWREVY